SDLGMLQFAGAPIQYRHVGLTFDSQAPRNIDTSNQGANEYIGNFQPEDQFATGTTFASVWGGLTPAALKGTWQLRITDFVNNGGTQFVSSWGMRFTSRVNNTSVGNPYGGTGAFTVGDATGYNNAFATTSAVVP